MSRYINPDNFFLRFLANFALFYSASLVVMAILFVTGHWDTFMCLVGLLAFSVLAALLRAAISKPGTPFMASPVFRDER
ncbi:hypothetical protein [Acidipropionibacterium timonense]|uniref:hypothetical protein n=1 Tax=Acidipropionibacterium timonense TaxID=2161818 RepID=UPI001030766D|nr:hypothetical protein [Acidipropionibacterium timonense]